MSDATRAQTILKPKGTVFNSLLPPIYTPQPVPITSTNLVRCQS